MQTISLKIDFRIISLVLGFIIVAMLFLWQPWSTWGQSERTISVTGEGSLQIEPDQFVFNPTYQKSAETKEDAQQQVTEQGNAVVATLKEMGVASQDIKTAVSINQNYDRPVEPIAPDGKPTQSGYIATYTLTITVQDKQAAQSVLNYLSSTSPLYSLTPQSTLSTESRQKYELDARKKALAHAKKQAEVSASELNAHVGKVVTVSDLEQTGGVIPLFERVDTATSDSAASSSPTLQTGQQEVTFSLKVVYELN